MHQLSIQLDYSKDAVKIAGDILSKRVTRTPETEEAFRVLHNWRLHHAYPMLRERAKLSRLTKQYGAITAGRLKRTSSIRKKLSLGKVKLHKIQDIVGCRAILNSMDEVTEVLNRYRIIEEGGNVRKIDDYISKPKESGYRSIHLIVGFDEKGHGTKHTGCNVEIQLRTRLQHVWATTVEAAGAMRNEDLKGGAGDREWLRFLQLMSGYIAEMEGQPRGDFLSMSYADLVNEIRILNRNLNVVDNLNTFRDFMSHAEKYDGAYNAKYLLKMNAKTGEIFVAPSWRTEFSLDDLDDDFEETRYSIEVSTDSMDSLRQAYPNYFEILNDTVEGHPRSNKNYFDRIDLSFLPKPKTEQKKILDIEYTGLVFWGGECIGKWEKDPYDTYFFDPVDKGSTSFSSRNLKEFRRNILDWLGAD
jgi:hypothetical protein